MKIYIGEKMYIINHISKAIKRNSYIQYIDTNLTIYYSTVYRITIIQIILSY